MTYIVQTHQLTKTFNGQEAVSGVSMNIQKGDIYGLLGPNGAGKTTIMKMLTNLVKPTSGEVVLFGEKITDASYSMLGRMGSIIEYPIFYGKLSAKENLDLHCEYMGYPNKKAIDEVLELVKLSNIDNKAVKHFSLGMKQRLGIARAMITKPELLILDEPINGLDPMGIKELRDLFQMLSKQYGITLLISSHLLSEIEQVADAIGVVNHGRLIQEVSMEQVRAQNTEYIELTTNDCKQAAYVLSNDLGISNLRVIDERVIRVYGASIPQSEITKALILRNMNIESITKKNSSLEDYFLTLLHGGEYRA
ncbi:MULTISPECIES: ABC transporter ATP-binding protein [Paenibacillus]|uniref:ABC transporter ATP-binding protein n=1 Tax=Paenibacillus TaxID=44249 RepID=UPI00112364F0|nr:MULTISPECIES: ABC transporter ATP-binding protein [Paenibacillus]